MNKNALTSIKKIVMDRDGGHLAVWWAIGAIMFGLYFAAWWMHLRPGVFSYDSGHYLTEVLGGDITNRKPFLYARFIELTSIGGRVLQLSVLAQVAMVVLVLSRAFAIAMASRVSPAWIGLCALLVLNPYVANMAFYLQNDVLFSFSMIAILVETLLIARRGYVTTASCVIIALASPMAFAFRDFDQTTMWSTQTLTFGAPVQQPRGKLPEVHHARPRCRA